MDHVKPVFTRNVCDFWKRYTTNPKPAINFGLKEIGGAEYNKKLKMIFKSQLIVKSRRKPQDQRLKKNYGRGLKALLKLTKICRKIQIGKMMIK